MAELAEESGLGGAAELSQAVSRLVAGLQDEDRAGRLRALAALRSALLERPLSPQALQGPFERVLLRPLSRCLVADPAERCRELALELLRHGLSRAARPAEALPVLMPALAQRLEQPRDSGGEPCEEIRLGLLQLLEDLLRRCDGADLAAYLPETTQALRGALLDPFPPAKRQACQAAATCAAALPDHFHMQSESLIGPLMQAVSHQHYKVRVAVIHTTGDVIQYGNVKSLDDVLSHLAQRCFDDIPQVREAVIVVVGKWLLHLRDRYSYFHKLIPLLLSGLTDEMHENRELALTYWKKIGLQWEKENEEDIKDKTDFYFVPSYYPPGLTRPGLGCRELVTRNLFKILPGLYHDVSDWLKGTRVKASELLFILLQHAEDHVTQHMEVLLRMLNRMCTDEESSVVSNCVKAAKMIGAFVSPAVSLKLILSDLEGTPMPSHLMILAAVIQGSPPQTLQPHLEHIARTLASPEISQRTEEVFYIEQLLSCVESLIELYHQNCEAISLQLTKVLVTIMAIPSTGHLHEKIEEAMKALAEAQHLPGVNGLYKQHITQLMEWVSLTHDKWTCYSPELLQLDVIAIQSGPVIAEVLQDFVSILKICLEPSRDPRMRLKLFTILSQLLQKPSETVNSNGQFCNYLGIMIKDILAPNLQWQAGRTAAAIRTTAVACLWALIYSELLLPKELQTVEDALLPQVLVTLEEDSKMTRLMSCRIVRAFLESSGKKSELSKIYPELLKRLDDVSHDVRLAAAKALVSWFKCIKDTETKAVMKNNIQVLYQELLVHMDDPDQNIQSAILDTLKEGGILYPDLLAKEIEGVVYKHRSPAYCNQLLLHIESMGWKYSES